MKFWQKNPQPQTHEQNKPYLNNVTLTQNNFKQMLEKTFQAQNIYK